MAHNNIKTIPAATEFFLEVFQRHPERDKFAAYEAALTGRRRKYPCFSMMHLVSPEFYTRFVLEHDRRIAETFGALHIHPCSGPHVFHVTLDNLTVRVAEAGFVAKAAAGSIPVDEALRAINGRPILLQVGQELPENREFEFIRADFDRYQRHPHMLFGYTGMHWRRKDRSHIRELHQRLDDYWERKYSAE